MWTDRDETAQCCPGPLGRVDDAEPLARTKIKRTKEPLFWTAFNLTDLYPPLKREADNECLSAYGQDGFSVTRAGQLTDRELHERSDAFAALGKNRVGDGAFVAVAAHIRAIRSIESGDVVAYRIYDDPIESNKEHSVIRGCLDIPEEERSSVMADLQDLFESDPR